MFLKQTHIAVAVGKFLCQQQTPKELFLNETLSYHRVNELSGHYYYYYTSGCACLQPPCLRYFKIRSTYTISSFSTLRRCLPHKDPFSATTHSHCLTSNSNSIKPISPITTRSYFKQVVECDSEIWNDRVTFNGMFCNAGNSYQKKTEQTNSIV